MHVHMMETIASGARFVTPPLLERLAAYHDETAAAVLSVGGIHVPIAVEVGEHVGNPPDGARIRLSAKDHTAYFPVFEGTLRIVKVTSLDSMLVLDGRYEVPLGRIGRLADRTVLRTTAERSLARLMAEMKAVLASAALGSIMGKISGRKSSYATR